MEQLFCPGVPLESAPGAAWLPVAVAGAGTSMLMAVQHQSHSYADLKINREIIHFFEEEKREMPWYWKGEIKGIQYNSIQYRETEAF